MGVSGVAAAKLLRAEGSRVTAIDSRRDDGILEQSRKLAAMGTAALPGCSRLPEGAFDVCIVSPGIRADSDWVTQAEARGIEVLSELELGASRCRWPMLAVTGSKGKSTLVKLCADALGVAGRRAVPCGNYGLPLCEVAASGEALDAVVVEVSSFQLEKVKGFRPRVGILLNIQPDHLDRHGDMASYTRLKARLFTAMTPADTGAVLDSLADDIARVAGSPNRWVKFGASEGADFRYTAGAIHYREAGGPASVSVEGTPFDNRILGLAAAAAVAAMQALGVAAAAVETAARRFEPLPHRMQKVAVGRSVDFVDDSKATNLAAMAAALEMCGRPVRLIAGGLLKETNLDAVKQVLASCVRKVYLIGQSSARMESAWAGVVPCCRCERLEAAVRTAWADAKSGEAILLSPGCASFDQFNNFEDRGNQFTALARRVAQEEI